MSILVELSPEALARLAAQRRNFKITAAVISLLVVLIIGLVLGFELFQIRKRLSSGAGMGFCS